MSGGPSSNDRYYDRSRPHYDEYTKKSTAYEERPREKPIEE
jgi:hypothetical protein